MIAICLMDFESITSCDCQSQNINLTALRNVYQLLKHSPVCVCEDFPKMIGM